MVEKNDNCSVIAEIANTHNGLFSRAIRLIEYASYSKADIIKFQIFSADDLVTKNHPEYEIFKNLEFSRKEWEELFIFSHKKELKVYADVFSVHLIDFLISIGCAGFKIHSSDINNINLLKSVANRGLPILLSIGGATLREIWQAISILKNGGNKNITLMIGFQAFPTQLADSKMCLIRWFNELFNLPVGYADHIDGESEMATILPCIAVSLGASIVEKHLTFDRRSKPDDFEASIEPSQFVEMVRKIRATELAIGSYDLNKSTAEIGYMKKMKKYPMAVEAINKFESIVEQNICFKRPESELDFYPAEVEDILDRKLIINILANKPFLYSAFQWKIAILLIVRTSSSRLNNKAWIDFCGQPAIVRLIERLKQCSTVNEIVLCTTKNIEDDYFIEVANESNVKIFRGSELDVLQRMVDAATMIKADIIVRVTGDDILSDPVYIDKAVKYHLKKNAEYTSVVGLPQGVDREIISVRLLKWINERVVDRNHTEYLSWYLDNPSLVRIANLEVPTNHFRPQYRLTLDTFEDLKLLQWIFLKLHNDFELFTLDNIIDLLDENPEIAEWNKFVVPKLNRSEINTQVKLTV